MADADYIVVFDKKEARIYDATTTIVSASEDPSLVAPRCQDTGLWKLDLDYEILGPKYPDQFIVGVNKQTPYLTSPTHGSLYFTTVHWRGFPQRKPS